MLVSGVFAWFDKVYQNINLVVYTIKGFWLYYYSKKKEV